MLVVLTAPFALTMLTILIAAAVAIALAREIPQATWPLAIMISMAMLTTLGGGYPAFRDWRMTLGRLLGCL